MLIRIPSKYLTIYTRAVLGIKDVISSMHVIFVKHVAHVLLLVPFKDNNIIHFDLCIYVTSYYHVTF